MRTESGARCPVNGLVRENEVEYIVLALMLLMMFGPEVQMFQPEGNDGSYLVIATLFAFASMPSMVLAWREKDI